MISWQETFPKGTRVTTNSRALTGTVIKVWLHDNGETYVAVQWDKVLGVAWFNNPTLLILVDIPKDNADYTHTTVEIANKRLYDKMQQAYKNLRKRLG